jgi:hypothetical protein
MTFRNLTQKTPKGRNVHGRQVFARLLAPRSEREEIKFRTLFLVFERDPMDVISRPSFDL